MSEAFGCFVWRAATTETPRLVRECCGLQEVRLDRIMMMSAAAVKYPELAPPKDLGERKSGP